MHCWGAFRSEHNNWLVQQPKQWLLWSQLLVPCTQVPLSSCICIKGELAWVPHDPICPTVCISLVSVCLALYAEHDCLPACAESGGAGVACLQFMTSPIKSPQACVTATLCSCRECHFWIRRFASNRGYLFLNQPRLSEQDPGRFKWQQLHHQLQSTPAGTSLLVADPIQLLADSKPHQPAQHRRQGEC